MKYRHCKKHNINSRDNSELFFLKKRCSIKNGKKYGPYISTSCILCRRLAVKTYSENNREKERERQREYSSKPENKIKARIRKLRFVKNNKEHIRKYNSEWEKNRRKIDPMFKIAKNLRTRLWTVLKRNKKLDSTLKLTGCNLEQLKKHLENKFEDGMSWDNYGTWHIDHIIGCANFDFSDPKQQQICFHYTNLQPMWGEHNMQKGSRLI
jgi:hypothetical protein